MSAHRSIIHNNQKFETIQIPMNWRTNQNVVHPGNEILLYEMKEERHKRDVKRYNPNKEDYTLFYIIYIKCLESRN